METPDSNSFAGKLERLFQEKTKPDGTQYTPADVLATTNGILTRVHLWKLRTGQATNPSMKTVQALADFFDVAPSYFFENHSSINPPVEMDLQEELKVILRNFELDTEEQKAVILVIDTIKNSKNKRAGG